MHPVISEKAVKAKAKALRAALADKGIVLNHQACVEVMARVEGEKSWAILNAKQNQTVVPVPAAPAEQAKAKVGFSETPGASIFDYRHELIFRNPEGNQVFHELYLTGDDARQAQIEWSSQGSDWCAEYAEFNWVDGVAVYPEELSEYDFRHQVLFTRADGTTFIDRYKTVGAAQREVDRWNGLGNSDIKAEYLGEEPAKSPDVIAHAAELRKSWRKRLDPNGPPADWKPSYSPWKDSGWYVSNVRYPQGHVGCVSDKYPDKKWRIVCDSRLKEIGGEGDFTYPTRDAAARAEYALAKAATDQVYLDTQQS